MAGISPRGSEISPRISREKQSTIYNDSGMAMKFIITNKETSKGRSEILKALSSDIPNSKLLVIFCQGNFTSAVSTKEQQIPVSLVAHLLFKLVEPALTKMAAKIIPKLPDVFKEGVLKDLNSFGTDEHKELAKKYVISKPIDENIPFFNINIQPVSQTPLEQVNSLFDEKLSSEEKKDVLEEIFHPGVSSTQLLTNVLKQIFTEERHAQDVVNIVLKITDVLQSNRVAIKKATLKLAGFILKNKSKGMPPILLRGILRNEGILFEILGLKKEASALSDEDKEKLKLDAEKLDLDIHDLVTEHFGHKKPEADKALAKAFRAGAMAHHPDKHFESRQVHQDIMQSIVAHRDALKAFLDKIKD